MRLTWLLLKPKPSYGLGESGPLPGKYLGRGKKRVPIISRFNIWNAQETLRNEEENMLLLRNPYLTFEQSFGHARDFGKHKAFMAQRRLENIVRRTKPDVTLEDRFNHLKVTDVWDC